MAFLDEIELHMKAGRGGDGVVRWRREKWKPLAGPGGGNGGRGGSVYVKAITDLAYLAAYQKVKNFKAAPGEPGGNFGRDGKSGQDLIVLLPVGSVITNKKTGVTIELTKAGEEILILTGGRGGLGNEEFKSSRNTTPYESTAGKDGEEADFTIELHLIADIGLVGFPNAGKSTLLNMLTSAKSKVASYQFTTLEPHLGVLPDGRIIADIPGLIEGAGIGKGLGHKFLKHIRRTKMIWHLISLEHGHLAEAYTTIRKELEAYDPSLLTKPEYIIVTKKDLVSDEVLEQQLAELRGVVGETPITAISAYHPETLARLVKQT